VISKLKIRTKVNILKLLCLSNGHGEDVIALRVLEQLQRRPDAPKLAALPLVGEGRAYSQLNIPIVGPVQKMPSGGFIYMDGRELWRDLQGGLIQLTLAQYQVVRQWGKSGGAILAVGDIVPLLFAWLSGADYAFIGTAKSEYYLRDETGWLPQTSRIERYFGSVYLPWDRWLMSHKRCKAVFPRDKLTTEILQQWSIRAFDLGNPMMDGIVLEQKPENSINERSLNILLLPGSRTPEADRNWQIILEAIGEIISVFSDTKIWFLAAIAPGLSLEPFQESLLATSWHFQPTESLNAPIEDSEALFFVQKNATLILTQNAYQECLLNAQVAVAMAGTATEQFVGLGKVAIAIPGHGPQFTIAFAEAQTRLLGSCVILVEQPKQVAGVIQSLFNDPARLRAIAQNGKRRMGNAGAAVRIAECLMEKLCLT
jgi:uncharacterized protein (TIGR03492 family)